MVIVLELLKLAGRLSDRMEVRSARDLHLRDLQEGNFILLGSPSTNPWVSLFDDRLNFLESVTLPDRKAFLNKAPRPGEPREYRGFAFTGSSGEEYATIALEPIETRRGNVLILQGLHQEGTDAAGLVLTTDDGRRKLKAALHVRPDQPDKAEFEALIRAKAVGGSSRSSEIIAVRPAP